MTSYSNINASLSDSNLIELVKHLRFIHFTLLVTCLDIFATFFANPSQKIERAIRQLDEINAVEKLWSSTLEANYWTPEDWIYDHAETTILKRRKLDDRIGPTYQADKRFQDGSQPKYLKRHHKRILLNLQTNIKLQAKTVPVTAELQFGEWEVFTDNLVAINNPHVGSSEAYVELPQNFNIPLCQDSCRL